MIWRVGAKIVIFAPHSYLITNHLMLMKKFLSVLAFWLLLGGIASAIPVQINLSVEINEPLPGSPGHGKGPTFIPSVIQDDYEIRFLEIHPYYTLCIVDEDDEVVYSVAVWSFTTSVVLPSWLSGDYEIQLRPDDNYYLYGYIEL